MKDRFMYKIYSTVKVVTTVYLDSKNESENTIKDAIEHEILYEGATVINIDSIDKVEFIEQI